MRSHWIIVAAVAVVACATLVPAQEKQAPPVTKPPFIKLLQKKPDPFGYPRPTPGSTGVPVRTSLYFEIALENAQPGDQIPHESLAVTLREADGEAVSMLSAGGRFAEGFTGHIEAAAKFVGAPSVGVYIEPSVPLKPNTSYTVQVSARSVKGATFPAGARSESGWTFTTGAPTGKQSLALDLDLTAQPVHWQGAFFSGFCQVGFCYGPYGLEPSFAMMARDRKEHPRAWGMQRELWLSGFEHTVEAVGWPFRLPNIVRELETRRVRRITSTPEGFLLKVEDFFGHEQYGIPADRSLTEDYQPGDEILIADGDRHMRAKVLAVDDQADTVLVSRYEPPEGGFKIDDPSRYNKTADPTLPGLSPMGGCYLRRFAPLGTPRYYWGRLDAQWDLTVARHGMRPIANFCDAPGDISVNGRSWSPPKDFAQYHEVVRTITSHIIDRYGGPTALSFFWSIFNEPDLVGLYWRGTREELHAFYDYSVDAILRAFEDHGLDSDEVFIGGLELAAPFPNLYSLDEFLVHCSPRGPAASFNAAVADRRLDGKRSRRVETLCRAHGGKGSPVDFISIHIYRASAAASLLTLAKQKALAVDAEYYENLWACSHETCPDWLPLPDAAYSDIYLGNGYYPAWCADYVWRQLSQGAKDLRYAMGNTVLSYFPWPNHQFPFGMTTAPTQIVKVDDDGDGRVDRDATLRTPIYHVLNLLGSLGPDFWVLPERAVAGHTVAGFAGHGPAGDLRILLYALDPADLQGRADQEFEIELAVRGLGANTALVTQHHFDSRHNSYFELGRKIRGRTAPVGQQQVISAEELRALEKQVILQADSVTQERAADDSLRIPVTLAGNGAVFLVIDAK